MRRPPRASTDGSWTTPRRSRPCPNQGTDPVYVGISADLARRGDEDHFRSGGSGFSTLRRSLGALLKDELKLTA